MPNVFNSWVRATDEGRDTYILDNFNKDWLNENESSQLRAHSRICGVIQTIDEPTGTVCTARSYTSTCLDLVFTNRRDRIFKSKVIQLGFTDHDLTVLSMKTKIPRGPPKIVYKRSYKHFSHENFINDLKFVPFWMVGSVDDPNEALDIFRNLFKEIADIHAPLRKYTVKTKPAPWLTDYMRDLMKMRDMAKFEAKTSGYPSDWAVYRKLRNYVLKIKRENRRSYFQNAINDTKNDAKSMWKTINNLIGRSHHLSPIGAGSNGRALSKPIDIANHFTKFYDKD